MHPLAILVLLGLFATQPVVAEKVKQPSGTVAPKADVQSREEARERKESAEWIKRCDKLKDNQRMQCLEDVRTRIVQEFDQGGGK